MSTEFQIRILTSERPLDGSLRDVTNLRPRLQIFVGAVDLQVGVPHALDARHQCIVALSSGSASLGIALLVGVAPIA